MKKLILLTLVLFVGLSMTAQKKSKNAKATFWVDGVCNMCEKRIEKAALKTKGVKYAQWDVHTHQLEVVYNARKTDLQNIKQNIANAGHDTDTVRATDEAYAAIHSCCKYREIDTDEDLHQYHKHKH